MNHLLPKLSNSISKKHKQFLESVGKIPYKVSADYALLLANITTKITLISSILREESVIDNFEVGYFGEYNKITLSKNGLDFRVEILTNGMAIRLKNANEMEADTWLLKDKMCYPKDDGWDWESFSDELVDFIHHRMYSLQKSGEYNFDNMMRGEIK